jgi:hypothetical protein
MIRTASDGIERVVSTIMAARWHPCGEHRGPVGHPNLAGWVNPGWFDGAWRPLGLPPSRACPTKRLHAPRAAARWAGRPSPWTGTWWLGSFLDFSISTPIPRGSEARARAGRRLGRKCTGNRSRMTTIPSGHEYQRGRIVGSNYRGTRMAGGVDHS